MIRKFVIASDKSKGSLTSAEVAAALGRGIRRVAPEAQVVELAVADGGEGTADTLVHALHGEWVDCRVHDPLGREITARYGVVDLPEGRTALIDMASASGLPLLKTEERDVLHTTTRGTGDMMLDAWRRGCRRMLVGIGGSATCDGGTGMLAALGYRFLDAEGRELPEGGEALSRLVRIDASGVDEGLRHVAVTVICDVTNPLCGPDGSAAVFGPQKGAGPEDVKVLDAALRRYADVAATVAGRDVSGEPGAGAAGGLGAAFLAFFPDSELCPGVDAVLDITGFDREVRDADLVITGEGRIDGQTLFGKLPLGVCRRAARVGVPTVVVAGMVEDAVALIEGGFAGVFPIQSRPCTLQEAMDPANASANLEGLGASIANFHNVIIRRQ